MGTPTPSLTLSLSPTTTWTVPTRTATVSESVTPSLSATETMSLFTRTETGTRTLPTPTMSRTLSETGTLLRSTLTRSLTESMTQPTMTMTVTETVEPPFQPPEAPTDTATLLVAGVPSNVPFDAVVPAVQPTSDDDNTLLIILVIACIAVCIIALIIGFFVMKLWNNSQTLEQQYTSKNQQISDLRKQQNDAHKAMEEFRVKIEERDNDLSEAEGLRGDIHRQVKEIEELKGEQAASIEKRRAEQKKVQRDVEDMQIKIDALMELQKETETKLGNVKQAVGNAPSVVAPRGSLAETAVPPEEGDSEVEAIPVDLEALGSQYNSYTTPTLGNGSPRGMPVLTPSFPSAASTTPWWKGTDRTANPQNSSVTSFPSFTSNPNDPLLGHKTQSGKQLSFSPHNASPPPGGDGYVPPTIAPLLINGTNGTEEPQLLRHPLLPEPLLGGVDPAQGDVAQPPPPSWCYLQHINPDPIRRKHNYYVYKKRLVQVLSDDKGVLWLEVASQRQSSRTLVSNIVSVGEEFDNTPSMKSKIAFYIQTATEKQVFVTSTAAERATWFQWYASYSRQPQPQQQVQPQSQPSLQVAL